MNKEIKKIVDDYRKLDNVCIDTLNQFAIEICELQKRECINTFNKDRTIEATILNTKNIAE